MEFREEYTYLLPVDFKLELLHVRASMTTI
jgi:hypothetical protein